VYPPVTHWIWTEEGWLKKMGYVDFSGAGAIHMTGGVCSFFAALFLGPRLGRFANKYNNSEKEEIVGHSVPVSVFNIILRMHIICTEHIRDVSNNSFVYLQIMNWKRPRSKCSRSDLKYGPCLNSATAGARGM